MATSTCNSLRGQPVYDPNAWRYRMTTAEPALYLALPATPMMRTDPYLGPCDTTALGPLPLCVANNARMIPF